MSSLLKQHAAFRLQFICALDAAPATIIALQYNSNFRSLRWRLHSHCRIQEVVVLESPGVVLHMQTRHGHTSRSSVPYNKTHLRQYYEKEKKQMRTVGFLPDSPLRWIIIIGLRVGLHDKARIRSTSIWELSEFEVDFSLIGYAIFTFSCRTERY